MTVRSTLTSRFGLQVARPEGRNTLYPSNCSIEKHMVPMDLDNKKLEVVEETCILLLQLVQILEAVQNTPYLQG